MSYGQKSNFQDGGRRHLEFWKFKFLVTWLSSGSIYALVYQILSKSDDFLPRYGDLAIFKMADVRHLGFVMTSQYCIAGHIFVVQILSWNFLSIGVVISEIQYLQCHKTSFWLYITDHGNFGVAHALYHVTLSGVVQNNHSYEIFDPYLPIHYATFMRLRWRLRGVLRWASQLLSDFLAKIYRLPSKMVPKMALIWGNGGLHVRFYDRDPEKAHSCAEPRVFAYFASKSI